jgi:hypothetical protein
MGVAMYKSDDIIKYLVGKYGAAIPMITMPLFAEQFFDEKFINTRHDVAKIKENKEKVAAGLVGGWDWQRERENETGREREKGTAGRRQKKRKREKAWD